MNKLLLPILLALAVSPLHAQTKAPAQPAANPQDVDSIDHIVKALYDVISGPAGPRDWNRMRSLFVRQNLMSAVVTTKAGVLRHITFTVDDYIRMDAPYFEKNGFFERESHRKTERFRDIAQLFSSYESRHDPKDRKPFEKGVNSIQLVNDGKRWWIVSILWQGATG